MELNCQVSSDITILNEYNKLYPWIPNEEQIRPTDMNIFMKDILKNKIKNIYNSTRDYILIDLFNYESKRNDDNKLQVINDNKLDKEYRFRSCRFRYKIDPKTCHYILWYNCDRDKLTTEGINKDIRNSIYNILQDDHYQFIWYENPKMSIDDIYHIQVFWIKFEIITKRKAYHQCLLLET